MKPWGNLNFEYPDIPTMITPEEIQYLYWLGRHFWEDSGHIVEVGPWLGGSTVCLASGMRDRVLHPKRMCHVFDNFVWRDFMSARASFPLSNGESFQPYFEDNLSDFGDFLAVHQQALPDDNVPLDKLAGSVWSTGEGKKIAPLAWNTDEPVEILFIDGAKSWTGLAYLLRVYSEALIPDKSLIVCQDYKFWGSYWVPMMFEYFMDHFEITHNLNHNTVSFRLKHRISENEFDNMPGYKDLGIDSGIELLETASLRLLNMGDQLGALILQGCKVRYCLNMGDQDTAIRHFRELEAKWPVRTENYTVNSLRAWLEEETGAKYAPTLHSHFGAAIRKARHVLSRLASRIL